MTKGKINVAYKLMFLACVFIANYPSLNMIYAQTNNIEVEIRKIDKVISIRESVYAWKYYKENTVGYVHLTFDGNIVAANEFKDSIRVVKDEDGIIFVQNDENYYPKIIGYVTNTGIIKFASTNANGTNAYIFDRTWPRVTANKAYPLENSDVVLNKHSVDWDLKNKPQDVIAWFYRTNDNKLIYNENIGKPFPNILWVVKDNNGTKFIHSGPEYTGEFAHIYPDFQIKFSVIPKDVPQKMFEKVMWKMTNENGESLFSVKYCNILPLNLDLITEIKVYKSGEVGIATTH